MMCLRMVSIQWNRITFIPTDVSILVNRWFTVEVFCR